MYATFFFHHQLTAVKSRSVNDFFSLTLKSHKIGIKMLRKFFIFADWAWISIYKTYLTIVIFDCLWHQKQKTKKKNPNVIVLTKEITEPHDEKFMKLLIEFVSFNIYYFFFIWSTAGSTTNSFSTIRTPKINEKWREKRKKG